MYHFATMLKGRMIFPYVSRKEFDIILLDINLKNSSEKNGFEILADILSINPDSKVVILSSYDMPIYKRWHLTKELRIL